ncbi:chaperonin 10-like protein [Nemania serpens]|nr:chaperonin 10-like protein [Nemania serpens]
MPDESINNFKAADGGKDLEPVVKSFHANQAKIRIQAEKIGTLQSFSWCETAVGEVPIEPGMVEIEVMAVGVNFNVCHAHIPHHRIPLLPSALYWQIPFILQDVATTMGIVPENEYTIGCECTGCIKRIAPGLETTLKVGDRVAAMRGGTYVNRVQWPHGRVHVIPDSMSFEDAAAIPLVYVTATYSLYHLGNLRDSQSVLIQLP